MVGKKPPGGSGADGWLPKLRGSAADSKARAARDAAERRAAGRHPKSVILNAKDVQGDYDAHRLLFTTMGGEVRPLTHDDLATFRHNVRTAQAKYKGGIRARQVLDLSLPDDRSRANQQIRFAVPVAAYGGRVRFMTNAGPESDVQHHNVTVEFLSYASAASGARGDAKKSAAWLRREPLKIECDCGRWRFWFRYIATIGKFNAGRDETGYPKIRNPNLHGVACKHILRVMAEVESANSVQTFLARLIDKARAQDENRVRVQTSQREAEQLTSKPASRIRDVETTMRQRQRAREKAALTRAAKASGASPPKRASPATRKIQAAMAAGRVNQQDLDVFRRFGMTDAEIARRIDKKVE
ncbi:hypothetical protein [Burkholderia plantarii]|uniref:SWIM-type domain-containing protein n=1 Tax=Burkholderia plantarii TaxID=41899 RepID=A0A0B6RVP5_BURPL|nr:hypothetical protein [Burkholderia plantarii]AJK46229.1 hypothetical protein BGL_1c17200 [Burkholderia plantarii]